MRDRHALAAERAAAGLSVSELARRTGVTPKAVRKWEVGGVPAGRMDAVSSALAAAPPPATGPAALEQLAELVRAEPGLTAGKLRARAGYLAGHLEEAERAGLLHREQVTVADTAGRRYSRVRVQPGPAPVDLEQRPRLSGTDVTGLRQLHGWSQQGLAARLGITRQRVAELERGGVPDARQEDLRRLLVEPLPTLDLAAARARSGLSQAELARRLGRAHSAVNTWEHRRRLLPLADAVRMGHVLAAAAEEDPVEDVRRRIVEVVAAAQPDGCTRAELTRALSRGRRRGHTGAGQRDAAALEQALRRRQVHWRDTWTRRRDGAWQVSPRLHPGPRRRLDDGQALSGAGLRRARLAAGVSQSELAAGLGTVWSTVSKWERRGRRPIPPAVTAAALEVLEQLAADRPDPVERARTRLCAAAAAEPGLAGWQLLCAAGYGKSNPTAQAVLAELLDAGELHLRLTPKRGTGGARAAVHPGPAPDVVAPTPLPGAELRRRRLAAGLRQRDLAAALPVSQTGVADWERRAVPALRVGDVVQALEDLARDLPEPLPEPLPGEQLRRARLAAGLSLAALGTAVGVSGPAVAYWERRQVPRGRVAAVRQALSAVD